MSHISYDIAKATPFEGKPKIMMPSVYGFSTGKEMFYTVPVIGERPIKLTVEGLPEGITFSGGRFFGKIDKDLECVITLRAENAKGTHEKKIKLSVAPDNLLRTPLMGFCTWNAFDSRVSADDVLETAQLIKELGLFEYGYNYINIDSGWQKEYGGKYDAVMPNEKFPDMKGTVDTIHSLGFKAGIYSTPMLTAWGCPRELESIPGCTVGEPDILCTAQNGGIGLIRKEKNNVEQWCDWGFDYLKYDWAPTDPYNAEMMKRELNAAPRDIAYCVTVNADVRYGPYWRKSCNSWRDNVDSKAGWENVKSRFATVEKWEKYVCPGRFYDLDMLAMGRNKKNLSEDELPLSRAEELFEYTMTAFFSSPIQLSMYIDRLTKFELDMICNDEIIDINQDALAKYPKLMYAYEDREALVYSKELENGDFAIAVFNLSNREFCEIINLDKKYHIRDVWAKKNVGYTKNMFLRCTPHTSVVFRLSEKKN